MGTVIDKHQQIIDTIGECHWRDLLADHLITDGYNVYYEVPYFASNIDLMARKDKKTIGIEVKLKAWKKAASQAFLIQPCVGLSVVAMPGKTADKLPTDLFSELGIGLWAIDGDSYRQIVEPRWMTPIGFYEIMWSTEKLMPTWIRKADELVEKYGREKVFRGPSGGK